MYWFLAVLGILVLAYVLQAGLLAFAGYVLLGVLALTRFLAHRWITALDAELAIDTTPREIGESVEVVVTVRNSGTLWIPWVLAEHHIPKNTLGQRKISIEGRRLRLLTLGVRGSQRLKYQVVFKRRGYYQFGPLFLETGDVFGLHRRHRVLTKPAFVLVYPQVLAIASYNFASERPIGEIRLHNRLFEDPTRTAGVRPYQLGDPLQRIHWRATARTGELHSRVYEPTSLAGATILLDFHTAGYPSRGEPYRSELAVTLATSLAAAVCELNQQIGFASNGRDATDRIREEALLEDRLQAAEANKYQTRADARQQFEQREQNDRLQPVYVETRRGYERFQLIRETLARLELTDGLSFQELLLEVAPRLPRDATLIAILPQVPVETSVALGQLRRQGFAITALLLGLADDGSESRVVAHGRLAAAGIRDVRFINTAAEIQALGSRQSLHIPADYAMAADLA